MKKGMGPAMVDLFNELEGGNMDEESNKKEIETDSNGTDKGTESSEEKTPDNEKNGDTSKGNEIDPHGFGPDSEGRYFDPEIHSVDDKGLPWKTVKKQTWAKKRGMRKAPPNINVGPSPDQRAADFLNSQEKDKEIIALSTAITDLSIMTAMIVGGEAYKPQVNKELGLDQRGMLIDGWKSYLKESPWAKEKIPAWAGLALGYGYYLLPPVVTQPTVKQRVKRAGKKVWDFITLKWIFGGKKDEGKGIDSGEK